MNRIFAWFGGRKATFAWAVLVAGVGLAAFGRLSATFVTLGLGLVTAYSGANVVQKAVFKSGQASSQG